MRLSTLKSIFAKTRATVFDAGAAHISIYNSFCLVEANNPKVHAVIRRTLTYDNQEVIHEIAQTKVSISMAFRYKKYGKVKWLKSKIEQLEKNIEVCWFKNDRFPTGHLSLVIQALDASGVEISLQDCRHNPVKPVAYSWANDLPPPRYFQENMLRLGVENGRGVFVSAVGSGKTYTAQLLIKALSMPALFVCPSKDLSVQTYDSFVHAFGDAAVELVPAGAKSVSKKPIRIVTVQTLAAALKKGVLPKLLKGIGLICVDEVHHAGAKSYTDLLPFFDDIFYRFGFSGTFLRNDSKTLDMWGFLSTVLYSYSAAQATAEGFLTPLKVLVHKVKGRKGNTYQREYAANYCDNPELLVAVREIFEEHAGNDQVLILVGRKDKTGKLIHEFLAELGIDSAYVSGDSDRADVKQALTDFNAKKINVLIGSSIIGEGIDVRSTDHLIMCQGGKSEIAITQALGRAARLYPGKKVAYIHDFRFVGTRYLEKHLEARLEIYQKNFNGEIL